MTIGRLTIAALLTVTAAGVQGATLEGTVSTGTGQPLAGAAVSAQDATRHMTTSVVTNLKGAYRIPTLFPGPYTVTAARLGFEQNGAATVVLAAAGARQDIRLEPVADSAAQVPAYAWLAALPDSPYKARFITGCTICHDPGAPLVRAPRDHGAWVAAIEMMRERLDIYSVIPNFAAGELADWLIANEFGVNPAAVALPAPETSASAGCVITAYDVGNIDSWAHDMAIEPVTGAAWVGDYPFDALIRVDPRTGAQQRFELPVKGGGAHTLHFDADGMLWITLQLSDMVARFNPADGTFRIFGGFQHGSLIHSFAYDEHGLIRRDRAGRIWMSEFGANSLASLDPDSGATHEYRLPGASGHTYGIALDSRDRVWYTKYMENSFGMLDPDSGNIVEKQMPRPDSAPHRMTIDTDDRLWIPNSGYGTLAMYDIRHDILKEYALPEPDTFPYAARYDGATGTVWVVGNGANSLYRFDPATSQFSSFRLPMPYAYGRMIAFDYASGDVWTSLSNYPTKHTGRTSGTLVRIQGVPSPARSDVRD